MFKSQIFKTSFKNLSSTKPYKRGENLIIYVKKKIIFSVIFMCQVLSGP